jgi:hypothetical protein
MAHPNARRRLLICPSLVLMSKPAHELIASTVFFESSKAFDRNWLIPQFFLEAAAQLRRARVNMGIFANECTDMRANCR